MDDLIFTELKFQNYLVSGNISDQKQNNLHFRTNYSENFRGQDAPKPFQVCRSHIDCQEHPEANKVAKPANLVGRKYFGS